jgi:cation-transporting ATPase 13A3/4/5
MELLTLRTFPFSSDDQCMSVVIQHSKSHEYLSLVKGSPEKLRRISKAETVPNDFDNILNGYTMQGLRVLGMGYKSIP